MKDKLEPNMYVRTKYGYICKIININDFREPNMKYGVEANYLKDVMFIGDDDIVKASYNIIDILEVGDMVNSLIVTRISEDNETNKKYINLYGSICEWENEDIKSVITHEQMEQMSYKVSD